MASPASQNMPTVGQAALCKPLPMQPFFEVSVQPGSKAKSQLRAWLQAFLPLGDNAAKAKGLALRGKRNGRAVGFTVHTAYCCQDRGDLEVSGGKRWP